MKQRVKKKTQRDKSKQVATKQDDGIVFKHLKQAAKGIGEHLYASGGASISTTKNVAKLAGNIAINSHYALTATAHHANNSFGRLAKEGKELGSDQSDDIVQFAKSLKSDKSNTSTSTKDRVRKTSRKGNKGKTNPGTGKEQSTSSASDTV